MGEEEGREGGRVGSKWGAGGWKPQDLVTSETWRVAATKKPRVSLRLSTWMDAGLGHLGRETGLT